jgi:flagellar P-ring protein precursor FlgI
MRALFIPLLLGISRFGLADSPAPGSPAPDYAPSISAPPINITAVANSSRIKDLTLMEGARDNQLIGYGLVSGLAHTGDGTQISQTVQSIANMLQRFGVNVPIATLTSGNVAAVMVTADIGPSLHSGVRADVTVSSIGDAKSIQGGILLQTPLLGADDIVYAVAQGPVAIGGFVGGSDGAGGATVQKNHPTTGIISNGAIVEREIPGQVVKNDSINLLLRNPDYTSAARMAEAINGVFPHSALAKDAATVNVMVPKEYADYQVNFIATLGAIDVAPDVPARIVINERTGTIIATSTVRISTVAVSHGSLTITIASNLSVSQPNALSRGKTVTTPSTKTDVVEQHGGFKIVDDAPSIERVAAALNALGLSTRDMMAIFQSMKRAGALQAELILN